jgi:hypothetical protein
MWRERHPARRPRLVRPPALNRDKTGVDLRLTQVRVLAGPCFAAPAGRSFWLSHRVVRGSVARCLRTAVRVSGRRRNRLPCLRRAQHRKARFGVGRRWAAGPVQPYRCAGPVLRFPERQRSDRPIQCGVAHADKGLPLPPSGCVGRPDGVGGVPSTGCAPLGPASPPTRSRLGMSSKDQSGTRDRARRVVSGRPLHRVKPSMAPAARGDGQGPRWNGCWSCRHLGPAGGSSMRIR